MNDIETACAQKSNREFRWKNFENDNLPKPLKSASPYQPFARWLSFTMSTERQ